MYKLPVDEKTKDVSLDAEWVNLIKDAKESGLTIAEVRNFLENPYSFNHFTSNINKIE
ncbi:hypothetical protein J6TS2_38620 [Heyndrickxia sporothermodurans]|nr:hypothetical protein J6TS2_38620 [Heyndrickxia sporothermodurans]